MATKATEKPKERQERKVPELVGKLKDQPIEAVTELAAAFKAEHEACTRFDRDALQHAMRAGEYLTKIKRIVGYGNFMPWVEQEHLCSYRSAALYMQLFKNRDKLHSLADLTMSEAIELLRDEQERPKSTRRPVPLPRHPRFAVEFPSKSEYDQFVELLDLFTGPSGLVLLEALEWYAAEKFPSQVPARRPPEASSTTTAPDNAATPAT